MDTDPKLEAQRSASNVYAFRRLKWGEPTRFRLGPIPGGHRDHWIIDAACWTAAVVAVAVLVWVLV